MDKKIRKISKVSMMHFFKLFGRSSMFLCVLIIYLVNQSWNSEYIFGGKIIDIVVLSIVTGILLIEMIFRMFPSKLESGGCQKIFKKNYIPTGEEKPKKMAWQRTLIVFISWITLNGVIGALYFTGVIDKGILILISLAYSICDMICILFFCPFQTWMMKNKCCTTCRIYNWDFIMMSTPLVFFFNPFTICLVVASLILLIQWEFIYFRHPERFSENTNSSINCKNCVEKLCYHKKQLQSFKKRLIEEANKKAKKIVK